MKQQERMRELVRILNEAARVYYQGQDEIMSNYEYDTLYDELCVLEKETGTVLAGSPTIRVGYETVSELPKEAHVAPMLSLDKTKEIFVLEEFLGEQQGILSLKLDGLSVIVTYENGELVKALTRGNGEVGEIITNNAKTFQNIPKKIAFRGHLVIRGEALIRYSDFKILNEEVDEIAKKYKNPRNLCSGSVRQLNNEITAKRRIQYLLYNVIETDSEREFSTKQEQMEWLSSLGFEVVPYKIVERKKIRQTVLKFEKKMETNDLPSDGLVLTFNSIPYSQSLGRTAKFPKDSIAFKWKDEIEVTTLKEIQWSASRTGLINPVAVFEPVELEGTTVSRASVHNISIVKELELGIGDTITVYKANMIIPQIQENQTRSGQLDIPEECPVCGEETEIQNENGTEVLVCTNPDCAAKKIKSFAHFVSRNAMNIDGLSESTLEKMIAAGMLHEPADLFRLTRYQEQIMAMEGFGEKSYQNLISAIDEAREVTLPRLIYSLGIKGIGLSMAKLICQSYPYKLTEMKNITREQLAEIDGVGEVLADNFVSFFHNKKNHRSIENLIKELRVKIPEKTEKNIFDGKKFVITGTLDHFENREVCKEEIEAKGGKVIGSVSKNTDYLVNNDVTSDSSKNKKAKQLGVPIISEEELLVMMGK